MLFMEYSWTRFEVKMGFIYLWDFETWEMRHFCGKEWA
jgi:hypothetical protein